MTEPGLTLHPTAALLRDPLDVTTRKQHRALLGLSVAAITVVQTGIVPTKIETLGVSFSPSDRASLLLVFAAVVTYYLAAFVVYAWSDISRWRTEVSSVLANMAPNRPVPMELRRARTAGMLRAAFDFGVPPAIGAYAVIVLLIASADLLYVWWRHQFPWASAIAPVAAVAFAFVLQLLSLILAMWYLRRLRLGFGTGGTFVVRLSSLERDALRVAFSGDESALVADVDRQLTSGTILRVTVQEAESLRSKISEWSRRTDRALEKGYVNQVAAKIAVATAGLQREA